MDRYDPYTDKFIKDATDTNVGTTDARQDFMDIVYSELAEDPDNNRANRIIWAADGYADAQHHQVNVTTYAHDKGVSLEQAEKELRVDTDTISRQAAIDALDEHIALCDDKALKSFGISMKDEYAVKVVKASLVAFRERLEYLPPAQPEPCEDAVSREAVKEQMLKYGFHAPDMTATEFVDDCLPLVTPKHRWIPCSERLPEVKQKVLVQYADGSMATKRCNDAGHLQWFYSNAVAWMPAPEPYQPDTK